MAGHRSRALSLGRGILLAGGLLVFGPAAASDTLAKIDALIETYGKETVIEVVQKERYGQITVLSRNQMKQMWGRPRSDLVDRRTVAHDLAQLGYGADTLEQRIQEFVEARNEADENAAPSDDYFTKLRRTQQINSLLYGGEGDTADRAYQRALEREAERELQTRLLETERDRRALERIQRDKDVLKMRTAASRGQITRGMPFGLVRQAWGPPTAVNHQLMYGQRVTVWHYRKTVTEEYTPRRPVIGGWRSWNPKYDPPTQTRRRVVGTAYVYFGEDGNVIDYSATTRP